MLRLDKRSGSRSMMSAIVSHKEVSVEDRNCPSAVLAAKAKIR